MAARRVRSMRASVQQIAAVNHPLRMRLLDLLALGGPATASQLAERTGQLVGNVSHHLKMLARAGLIAEAGELAKDRRERWWQAVPVSLSWSLNDVRGDPTGETVALAAEERNLARHVELARQWLVDREGQDAAWVSAAFSTEAWAWATPDELADLGRAVNEVVTRFRATHQDEAPGRRPCFVFAHGTPARP